MAVVIRASINLAPEVLTDVTKTVVFSRFVGGLPPARVHNVLAPLDVALVSVVSLNTYGLILAGILLAAYIALAVTGRDRHGWCHLPASA